MHYQIVSILDSVLGIHHKQGKNELYYFCPFCHHHKPKLAVNVLKRKWQCWKCQAAGRTLLSLVRRLNVGPEQIRLLGDLLRDELPLLQNADEPPPTLVLPSEYIPLHQYVKDAEYHRALAYLAKRGITPYDILRYEIGYCKTGPYHQRIIIPSFDDTFSLNYFVGRTYQDWALNYLTPPISKNIIGLENQINWKYPIVIVEGIFDAMAVKRNAIPLFGKHISAKLRKKILQEGVNQVYLALDADALKETIRHAEKLMREGIDVYVVDMSDKDPSVIGFAGMQHLLKNAQKLTFKSLMELKLRLT